MEHNQAINCFIIKFYVYDLEGGTFNKYCISNVQKKKNVLPSLMGHGRRHLIQPLSDKHPFIFIQNWET